MKHLSIILATAALAVSGCKKEAADSPFADERIRQIEAYENGNLMYTYQFYYDENKDLDKLLIYYNEYPVVDTFLAIQPGDTYLAENIGSGTTELEYLQVINGLATTRLGTRTIGAGYDFYYYKNDTGTTQFNGSRQMIHYENYEATDSTGCEPERQYMNIGYTNGNYTSISGYSGFTICGSSSHFWVFPDLQFHYGPAFNSLGFENFGIRYLGVSNRNALDSITGTIHADMDNILVEERTDTIRYMVSNTFDNAGRTIKTNYLPYDFHMANYTRCGNAFFYLPESGNPFMPFYGVNMEFHISYY